MTLQEKIRKVGAKHFSEMIECIGKEPIRIVPWGEVECFADGTPCRGAYAVYGERSGNQYAVVNVHFANYRLVEYLENYCG